MVLIPYVKGMEAGGAKTSWTQAVEDFIVPAGQEVIIFDQMEGFPKAEGLAGTRSSQKFFWKDWTSGRSIVLWLIRPPHESRYVS